MQVGFSDARSQKLFNSSRELVRVFGPENARMIRRRLDDLRAAPSLEDAQRLPGRLEELKADRKGQFSMRLLSGYRLIFMPAVVPLPTKSDGGLDLTQIREITVLNVEDYHG